MKKVIKSGIYKILNLKTNKFYIGSSKNLLKRFREHLSKLKCGNHINKHLQHAFNVDGEDNFKFEIIIECDVNKLMEIEQHYLDSADHMMYNFSKCAGGGDKISYHPNRTEIIKKQTDAIKKWRNGLTEKEKLQISERNKGNKNPNFGRFWTEEMKEALSKKTKGKSNNYTKFRKGKNLEEAFGVKKAKKIRKKFSDFAKTKIGDKNPFFGKKHTEEYKEKARIRRSGKYYGKQNIPFSIDGKEYKSLGEASKELNIHITTIRHRLNSKNVKFSNYIYV